jgi:uncharacterized lipoprotein
VKVKKVLFLVVVFIHLSGCAMVQDQRQAMTATEGQWQQYTKSIPVVDLPPGMRAGSLQAFYRVPPAKKTNKPKALKQVDGVFLPPQVQ